MIFSERNKKKNFVLYFCLILLLFGGIFFLAPSFVSAAQTSLQEQTAAINTQEGGGFFGWLAIVVKAPIYGFFVAIGWFASAALTLFEWVIKPENISGPTGLLNQPNIYEMWKFIRDFFNLFFILVLLYIAFTVVFQIQKNFKKALLSLILAALFVNFSFPISRFMIDVANVPMYFFANQIAGIDAGTGVFGQALSVSKIQYVLLPGSEPGGDIEWTDTPVARFLVATIVMFLFSITLLILAVMFVIRLVALMILVVFSSVGFAAAIIPGLEPYSKMWWDNFRKYVLFGPVAMLMLLVATRFFSAMNDANAGVFGSLNKIAGSISKEPTFIASLAMVSLPIMMLWMAIGLAQKSSIVGGEMMAGKGKAFAKWAGRKTYDNTYTRGIGKGIKERAENNKYAKVLTPKFWNEGSKKREERIDGRVGGGTAGYNRVVENQHNKKVAEEEKRMEEARTSEPQLRDMMANPNKHDKATVEAAVRQLSKKDKFQSAADMNQAVNAMNVANTGMHPDAQKEKVAEIVKKAGGEIYNTGDELAAAIGHLGTSTKDIGALIDKAKKDALNTMKVADYKASAPETQKKLAGKMKKEGAIMPLVKESIVSGTATDHNDAVAKIMTTMNPADAAKVFGDATLKPHADAYLAGIKASNKERYGKIKADA